jgi:hypothetical protein
VIPESDESPSQESRARARRLEQALKEALSGQFTPGSGNQDIKGDMRSDFFLGEAKYRRFFDHGPAIYLFPLDIGWLDTIYNQALADHRLPVLAIEWYEGQRMALLPHADYCSLTNYLGEPTIWQIKGRHYDLIWRDVLHAGWPIHFHIRACDVPCKDWMGISWEQLTELGHDMKSQLPDQEQNPQLWPKKRRFPQREFRGGRGFQSGWRKR